MDKDLDEYEMDNYEEDEDIQEMDALGEEQDAVQLTEYIYG